MTNRIDEAIASYSKEPNSAQLRALDDALLEEDFCVPLDAPVKELRPGEFDVAALCVTTESGLGALAVFTALEHLYAWKPQGCLYASLSGRRLIDMARGMAEISEILINPASAPRGSIPRSDFARMLALR